MHTPQNPLPDDLAQTVNALNRWRNLRPNRQAPLPHALRRQILALADHYPIARLVKALRINHSMFKRWQQQEAETLSSEFIELAAPPPDEVAWVLTAYGTIWGHEDHCREQGFSPAQRQAYHQAHSLPVMEGLRDWGQAQLNSGACEANSGLGRAIQYFMKPFEGLTQFCRIPGAQLDNNVMERQLKLVIRNRKNAGFFKSSVGAAVGDVITSVIATTAEAGENILLYLTALQRHAQVVKQMPKKWLPWNWRDQ